MKTEEEIQKIRSTWQTQLTEADNILHKDFCRLVIKVLDEILGD